MSTENRVVDGLCYLSILFAPIIFPLIVWVVGSSEDMKYHAKSALFLHILPVLLTIVMVVMVITTGMFTSNQTAISAVMLGSMIVIGVIDVILYFWNIIKGVRVMIG